MTGIRNREKVLVADDESDVLHMVASSLVGAGFFVVEAHDGEEALELARTVIPAIVVLDLMMPRMSGTEVLRALKFDPRTAAIPVLILTARRDEIDRVLAFELGADDYVTKPFSPRELTLRIQGILARGIAPNQSSISSSGCLSLDRERHEVTVKGEVIEVTAMEYRLLSLLMQRIGRVFARTELITSVWGTETEIDTRTVDTHLRRLREKLGPAAERIQTVRGVGYRLAEQ